MKIKQKGLLCITIVILLALVCGITGCKQNKTAAEIEAEIKQGTMDYLNEKYEDTFTITNYLQLAFPGGSGVDLKIQSEKYQEEFSAHVDYEDDGYVYTDTYFTLAMREDAEKYFYELAKPFLGEGILVKIQFMGSYIPDESLSISNFSKYTNKNTLGLDVFLFDEKKAQEQEATIDNMIKEIISRKLTPKITYISVKEGSKEKMRLKSLNEILNNSYSIFEERQAYLIWEDFSVEKYELQKYKTKK